ncbi:midnolin isoform X2 [Echeneis naucrates]|uniref:midnolin isoform X2 n=1 Tax=Echeneis naucrates TaxID=173247 RepID=UPI001113A93B|nr:midnolin-like isoform X2 [Echeneis naucrates]
MEQQRGLWSFSPARSARIAGQDTMRLAITSTTGSPVELTVPRGETVEGLRTRISQRLRLQTDRILLLHKDRQLSVGKLLDLGVADGSKLTLVPVIEAGLVCSTVKAERTVMDVLESLTEIQISDFLSGRSPLTINLGIGAQTMYVQLQLSEQDAKKLQQDGEGTVQSSSEHQTGLPVAAGVNHAGSALALSSTSTTGSTTSLPVSPISIPDTDTADSTPQIQLDPQRPKTSYSTAVSSSHSSTTPAVNCHHHASLPLSCQHVHTAPSTPSSPSGRPRSSCLPQAATPICSAASTGSSSRPPSPVPASTFEKNRIHASPSAELYRQPGAVIDSFVSHSPGVFSGTFSGTLAPQSQSISHPRRGIAIILQILNDLLRAASSHQRAPAPLRQHCPVPSHPVSPVPAEEPSKARGKPLVVQRTEHLSTGSGKETYPLQTSTEEDQTLQCKLERLQFLMHQQRLRRQTRRSSHFSKTSHPYQHRHHCP